MAKRTKTSRERMVEAAASLLAKGGRDAVSTRAVSAAAGVQAPAIYRQFGDMRGLLDAVVNQGFNAHLASKAVGPRPEDPVDDLREGWRRHVAFGLANPALYKLMYGEPRPGVKSEAAQQVDDLWRRLVHRIAEAGRLRVSVDRAVRLLHAGSLGITFVLLGMAPEDRELELSESACEAILAAVTTDSISEQGLQSATARAATRAVALKAVLEAEATELSAAERLLLGEWLDRIAERP